MASLEQQINAIFNEIGNSWAAKEALARNDPPFERALRDRSVRISSILCKLQCFPTDEARENYVEAAAATIEEIHGLQEGQGVVVLEAVAEKLPGVGFTEE